MAGKHIFGGTVEVPQAKTNSEAVNLGQVKDLVNRYNKEPVRVATTAELSGTYATGVLTLDSQLTILDGVTLAENDAILVKDQSDKTQNGIYIVDATGDKLTRREDFAEGKTILNNTFVNIMEGTANGDTRWTIVSDGVLTVNSSNITFVKDIDTATSSINVVKGSITGDDVTTAFNVAHNLNLTDVNAYILLIKDSAGNTVYADDVPTTANEANSITVTFSVAPATGETYKVFILGLE
ncbi:MAG: hypothetical protein ACI4WU_04825 [Bacilli bacterium]